MQPATFDPASNRVYDMLSSNPLIEMRVVDERVGRGLYAKQKIMPHQVLHEESPLLVLPFEDNKRVVKSCTNCLRSFEEPHTSMMRINPNVSLTRSSLPYVDRLAKIPRAIKSVRDQMKTKDIDSFAQTTKRISMPFVLSASVERDNNNHVPLQVARLFCLVLADAVSTPSGTAADRLSYAWSKMSLFMSDVPFPEITWPHPREGGTSQEKTWEENRCTYFMSAVNRLEESAYSLSAKRSKEISHRMLLSTIRQMLYHSPPSTTSHSDFITTVDNLASPLNYDFLLGLISINGQGVVPTSPFTVYWNNVKSLPKTAESPMSPNLHTALQSLIPIMSQFRDTPRIDSSRGSALYTVLNTTLNHSCVPNARVECKEDATVTLISTRDIEPGEQIVECYVDPRLSWVERQFSLRCQYLFCCKCPRCIREEPSHQVDIDDRWLNASAAKIVREDKVKVAKVMNVDYEDVDRKILSQLQDVLEKLMSGVPTDFQVEVSESKMKNAGRGLFVRGRARAGSILSIYGGVVMTSQQAEEYARENRDDYLLRRPDGLIIDGDIGPTSLFHHLWSERRKQPCPLSSFSVASLINHFNNEGETNAVLLPLDIAESDVSSHVFEALPCLEVEEGDVGMRVVKFAVAVSVCEIQDEEISIEREDTLMFMAVFVNGDIHAMMMFHLLLTLFSLVKAEYWIQYVFEDARCIGDRPTNATIFARPINKASICYPSADGRGYALSTLSSGAYSMIAYTDRLCTNVDPKIRTTRFPSGVCTQGIIIRYVAKDNMDTFAPPKGNDEVIVKMRDQCSGVVVAYISYGTPATTSSRCGFSSGFYSQTFNGADFRTIKSPADGNGTVAPRPNPANHLMTPIAIVCTILSILFFSTHLRQTSVGPWDPGLKYCELRYTAMSKIQKLLRVRMFAGVRRFKFAPPHTEGARVLTLSTLTILFCPTLAAYWYESVAGNGLSPYVGTPSNYLIYRNVVSLGADKTGQNDVTSIFQNAINQGDGTNVRNSGNFGTSRQMAVVYLPAGTYLLNNPLQFYVGTVLMGDPTNPPTIILASTFPSAAALYCKDPRYNAVSSWYTAIKNIKIDSTRVDVARSVILIEWSVGLGCYITNVVLNMPNYSTGHVGLNSLYGGSTLIVSDTQILGGAYGININSAQQFQMKSIIFSRSATSINIVQCFTCLFIDVNFSSTGTGINMTNPNSVTSDNGDIGTVTVVDAVVSGTNIFINTITPARGGDHTLILQNVLQGSGVNSALVQDGTAVAIGNVTGVWMTGYSYGMGSDGMVSKTSYTVQRDPTLLDANGIYATVPSPTFSSYAAAQVVNVKSVSGLPVYGDGTRDDTTNLQTIINNNVGKLLFFPAGTYKVSQTLFFPINSRVYGEAWPAISASGSFFSDASNPKPLVLVGNVGDVGTAQFVDMIFTVAQPLPGCILMRINAAGDQPGNVGMWNSFFRVGGTNGTTLLASCSQAEPCKAAYLQLHLTPTSSVYLENVWGWTADHDIDNRPYLVTNVSVARGLLVESRQATWLHGISFQHHAVYQINIRQAVSIFLGLHETEAPFWQGQGAKSSYYAPSGWAVDTSLGDPTFSNCASTDAQCLMAWNVYITRSSNVYIYNSAMYAFFANGLSCSATCQRNGAYIDQNLGLFWYGVNSHYLANMIVPLGLTTQTRAANLGPFGGTIGAWTLLSKTVGPRSYTATSTTLDSILTTAQSVSVGVTITLAAGTYTNTIDTTGDFTYTNFVSSSGGKLTGPITLGWNSSFNGVTLGNVAVKILSTTFAQPNFTRCTFTSSNVSVQGNVGLNITNSVFTGATDAPGPAIYPMVGAVQITGSNFNGFLAGALSINNPFVLQNTNFTGNLAASGAALTLGIAASGNVNGCVFRNNNATVSGGAVNNSATAITFTGCSFYNNNAAQQGGAIYFAQLGPVQNTVIRGCYFERNSATLQGGAIASVGSADIITVNSCQFVNCFSAIDGGVLYISGSAAIVNSTTVINGYSVNGDGGFVRVDGLGTLMLYYSTLTNCNANNGGAVRASAGAAVSIGWTKFVGCSADVAGGAIYNSGTMMTQQLNLTSSYAPSGGAIFSDAKGVLSLANGVLLNNSCTVSGCGVYSAGSLSVVQSSITNNNGVTGSAATIAGGRAVMTGTTISHNTASSGGAVQVNSGDCVINGGGLLNNTGTAVNLNGAIGLNTGRVIVTRCNLSYTTGLTQSNASGMFNP
ncbi:putative exo-beta-1,3-glucanase [Planoprotostelium fungivorum]|uniref:Putative exo-beta-1,3-glucanase n=1 Tax=Planoprotostelium fungivorum TaxID=1890364 RepID=A0A2P6NC15_9EUKA|nr:putative exo-beta-1,3-glucanase [Planoprotostelium fungivorum]